MYRIITWAVGLCSLPSTLIPSGEQKEPWVLALAGSTGPYKVRSRSGDLSFCHLSELTAKPSDAGETSRWNITGAAGVDCRVCLGSLSDLFIRSCAPQSPVFLHMIHGSSCCISAACMWAEASHLPHPDQETRRTVSHPTGLLGSSIAQMCSGAKTCFLCEISTSLTFSVCIIHEAEGRCWLSVAENLKLMEISASPTAKKPSVEEEPSTVPDAR